MEGNQMKGNNVHYKMREIVKQIREALLADSGMGPATALHAKIDQLTQAALELPLRQCDVSTAKEQTERFKAFCRDRQCGSCYGCPIPKKGFCTVQWAQMPYEAQEGGAK